MLEAERRKYIFCPLSQGLKAPLFIYEKGKRIFFKTPRVKKKGVLV
jgi:hypothetical protein